MGQIYVSVIASTKEQSYAVQSVALRWISGHCWLFLQSRQDAPDVQVAYSLKLLIVASGTLPTLKVSVIEEALHALVSSIVCLRFIYKLRHGDMEPESSLHLDAS